MTGCSEFTRSIASATWASRAPREVLTWGDPGCLQRNAGATFENRMPRLVGCEAMVVLPTDGMQRCLRPWHIGCGFCCDAA